MACRWHGGLTIVRWLVVFPLTILFWGLVGGFLGGMLGARRG
jgi:hypothetical protein